MATYTIEVDRVEIKDAAGNVFAHSDMTLQEAVAAFESSHDALARYWIGMLIEAKTSTEAGTNAMLSATLQKKTPEA